MAEKKNTTLLASIQRLGTYDIVEQCCKIIRPTRAI